MQNQVFKLDIMNLNYLVVPKMLRNLFQLFITHKSKHMSSITEPIIVLNSKQIIRVLCNKFQRHHMSLDLNFLSGIKIFD